MLPVVLPSVATLLPVSGNTKNGVLARKTKVKICVLPMLPNIIYFSYAFSFFFFLSLSLVSSFFFLQVVFSCGNSGNSGNMALLRHRSGNTCGNKNRGVGNKNLGLGYGKSRHEAICGMLPVREQAATLQRQQKNRVSFLLTRFAFFFRDFFR